jgi:hypothetical protein
VLAYEGTSEKESKSEKEYIEKVDQVAAKQAEIRQKYIKVLINIAVKTNCH